MQVIIETATGKALHIYDDADLLNLLSARLVTPTGNVYDVGNATHSIVQAPAPTTWAGGGALSFIGGAWVVNDPIAVSNAQNAANTIAAANQAAAATALAKAIAANVQLRLDTAARARGYGDDYMSPTLSISTYDNDLNPKFAADAATFKAWRSATWVMCYQLQAEALAGTRVITSYADVEPLLPVLTWP